MARMDGLKVEGLAVRETGGAASFFIGSDDESYGGAIRPLSPFP